MERRELLKGMLLSVSAAASTALVKLASPQDILALSQNGPEVLMSSPLPPIEMYKNLTLTTELFVREANVVAGQPHTYVPIGHITEIHYHMEPIDITSSQDSHSRFMPGPIWVSGAFHGRRA